MILYCDTSALVKRYVWEAHSDEFRSVWSRARRQASAEIAYAEAVAAFARRWRCGDISDEGHASLRRRFAEDFRGLVRVPQSEEINRRVFELVLEYPLRGFDAVHLASALLLKDETRADILFACYDEALNRAARTGGLRILEGQPG